VDISNFNPVLYSWTLIRKLTAGSKLLQLSGSSHLNYHFGIFPNAKQNRIFSEDSRAHQIYAWGTYCLFA